MIDLKGMVACMRSTSFKYPCVNIDCGRRGFCPLAHGSDIEKHVKSLIGGSIREKEDGFRKLPSS